MEIRVLRYFLMIANEGSITNAANILHVTQPTLSRQIKELESELGRRLFKRRSHSVELTADGEYLRKKAEEIVSIVDKIKMEFRGQERAVSGNICIGGDDTAAVRLSAEIFKELSEKYPGIRTCFYSGSFEDIAERIDRGILDMGIVIGQADPMKYENIRIPVNFIWGVLMREDSRFAEDREIGRNELYGLPLICPSGAVSAKRDGGFIDWVGGDIENLDIITTFSRYSDAEELAKAGIGCVLTVRNPDEAADTDTLCFRPLSPLLSVGMNIIWKKDQSLSRAAEIFLGLIQRKMSA